MSYERDALQRDYETLGVNARDSAPSIRRRYRQLVKRWHPDRFSEGSQAHDQATSRIRAINAAYAQIKDAPLRRTEVLPTRPIGVRSAERRRAPAAPPRPLPRRSSGAALAATLGVAIGLLIEFVMPMGRQMLGQAAGWMVLPVVGAALGPVCRGVIGRGT
jgi:preprotein translocase subunit Sec63